MSEVFKDHQYMLSRLEAEKGSEDAKVAQLASALTAQNQLGKEIFSQKSLDKLRQLQPDQLRALQGEGLGEKFQQWLDSRIQASCAQRSSPGMGSASPS